MKWQFGLMSLTLGLLIGASISGASAHPEFACLPPPPCAPCPQLEFPEPFLTANPFLTAEPVFTVPFVERASIQAEPPSVEQHEAVLRAFEAIKAVEEQEADLKAEKEVQKKE